MMRSPLSRGAKPLKRSWLRPKLRVRRVLWRTGQVIEDAAGMMALRSEAYQRSQDLCECWRATGKEPCGQRVTWWSGQLHHIIARARGGSDVIGNVAFNNAGGARRTARQAAVGLAPGWKSAMPVKTDLITRFMSHVEPEPMSGCWLWSGSLDTKGYGKITIPPKTVAAHRIAFILFIGPIPSGKDLDHICRVRSCVNPAHLEAVPRRVNLLRGNSLVAHHSMATHCPAGHEYNALNTRMRLLESGFIGRGCKSCDAEAHRRKRRERNRL